MISSAGSRLDARHDHHQPLVNVAAVHESRPIVVKLSDKARRFIHAAFRNAGLDRPSGDGAAIGIAVIKVCA